MLLAGSHYSFPVQAVWAESGVKKEEKGSWCCFQPVLPSRPPSLGPWALQPLPGARVPSCPSSAALSQLPPGRNTPQPPSSCQPPHLVLSFLSVKQETLQLRPSPGSCVCSQPGRAYLGSPGCPAWLQAEPALIFWGISPCWPVAHRLGGSWNCLWRSGTEFPRAALGNPDLGKYSNAIILRLLADLKEEKKKSVFLAAEERSGMAEIH